MFRQERDLWECFPLLLFILMEHRKEVLNQRCPSRLWQRASNLIVVFKFEPSPRGFQYHVENQVTLTCSVRLLQAVQQGLFTCGPADVTGLSAPTVPDHCPCWLGLKGKVECSGVCRVNLSPLSH
ncbi:Hypothetical predicted protein [Podarcis lilfordi]|uniref:Uncharacterized protein n=1 Tax=Podarcis lilfordi TaxID=74358 RepID=A0AA35LEK4_9SAUR|nr:Hypothetical predicted protein [Podarcis lilfordi]